VPVKTAAIVPANDFFAPNRVLFDRDCQRPSSALKTGTNPEKGRRGVYLPNSRPKTLALVSQRLRMTIERQARSAGGGGSVSVCVRLEAKGDLPRG
jgi:hypothetical protein